MVGGACSDPFERAMSIVRVGRQPCPRQPLRICRSSSSMPPRVRPAPPSAVSPAKFSTAPAEPAGAKSSASRPSRTGTHGSQSDYPDAEVGMEGASPLAPTRSLQHPIRAWIRLADPSRRVGTLHRPRGGQKPRFDHAAAPWYSWTSPPSRSRRRTSRGSTGIGSPAATSGGARPRARCGRCRL